MRFVIVTGMSGAGKSTTLKMMEDMGYFCVDNMPIPLMTKLTELLIVPNGEITKIALGLDIRSGQNLRALDQVLDELEKAKIPLEILFLESNDDTLVKRYKETRRNHPLSKGGRIENGIAKERKKIAFLKERADYILDTSRMLTRELRSELNRIFAENKEYKNLYITVLSFGFKYGIPSDADLVFDVRFLDITMLFSYTILFLCHRQPFIQLIGKCHGAVFSAGTSDCDHKLVLSFCNIIRNQELNHVDQLLQEFF